MASVTREEALEYHHLKGKPGKIEVVPTKPMDTQRDLSLAYTPGVAEPVLDIEKDPELAYEYTSKGNLVAVITNGTAILGLGDRGALASKPVMEGKGVLFKKFADVDVFDIEVNTHDPDEIIRVAAAIAPTFGGINLEDIKAPECFYIEEELKKMLDIPVFHDDQHGTAIISSAGLANALAIVGKKHSEVRLTISGAGASAISCAELAIRWGVKRENIMLVDSKGVVYKGRTEGMNKYKERFLVETDARTLADAVRGADVFYGLSVANVHVQGHGEVHGEGPDRLRDGQPRPGDQPRGCQGSPQGRDHRDRPLGLPQPDQQRARLPVHLPRCAGRARQGDQRGDEVRGLAGAGRAGQGGCAGFGAARLRRGQHQVRPRLHHPQAAGSARAAVGGAGGGRDGHQDRRGAQGHRYGRVPPAALLPAGAGRAGALLHHEQGARQRRHQADRLRRGRGAEGHPRGLPDPGREDRHSGADRPASR